MESQPELTITVFSGNTPSFIYSLSPGPE